MKPGGEVLLGFLVSLFLLLPIPAQAHDASDWFDPLAWDNYQDIDYKIDESIPGDNGSEFEERIHDGKAEWNAVTGVDNFRYDNNGNGNENWQHPCNWMDTASVDIWIFYHDIPSVGEHLACAHFHQSQGFTDIHSARIAFDTDSVTWYKGTGNPPSGEAAVHETALHEFGHGTGVYRGGNPDKDTSGGHWPAAPSNQCAFGGSESDWTMCPAGTLGHKYRVPLEPHDIDTFQDFY